jgi:hypothetical protein
MRPHSQSHLRPCSLANAPKWPQRSPYSFSCGQSRSDNSALPKSKGGFSRRRDLPIVEPGNVGHGVIAPCHCPVGDLKIQRCMQQLVPRRTAKCRPDLLGRGADQLGEQPRDLAAAQEVLGYAVPRGHFALMRYDCTVEVIAPALNQALRWTEGPEGALQVAVLGGLAAQGATPPAQHTTSRAQPPMPFIAPLELAVRRDQHSRRVKEFRQRLVRAFEIRWRARSRKERFVDGSLDIAATLAFARPRIERQAARLEPGAAAGSCATRQLSSSCMAPLIRTARLTPPFITTAGRNCFEALAVICNLQRENSAEPNPTGDRGNSLIVDKKKHVRPGRSQVGIVRNGDLQRGRCPGSNRQVD